jgi:hypothetical protein
MYNSLSKIPTKLFYEILATNNLRLLLEEKDIFVSNEMVELTWKELKSSYDSKYSNNDNSLFEIRKEIEILGAQHTQIILACHSLRFDWDQELIDILRKGMYTIKDDENYHNYIDTIERQSEALIIKINRLKGFLPKETEQTNEETSLDDVMASYCSILGIDFDFETIPVTKFFSLQKQVDLKIQNLKKQSSKKV